MIVDLFCGMGGWSEGALLAGVDEPIIGIDHDAAACRTHQAAGHPTLRADVATYPTEPFRDVSGIIASPPCQAFSQAGKGEGRKDIPRLHAFVDAYGHDGWADPWEWAWTALASPFLWADERTPLVLQPLRWVQALRPRWIALEQVPDVLELWQHFAQVWRAQGYHVWAGVLSAERYGVPQVRKRAILMAHRERIVQPPTPTHQAYVNGEGARHESTLDGELLPWVSMAQALGWGAVERPVPVVTAGGTDTGGPEPFPSSARNAMDRERERSRWVPKVKRTGHD